MPRLLLGTWLAAALLLPAAVGAQEAQAAKHSGSTASTKLLAAHRAARSARHVHAQRAAVDKLAARDPAVFATTLAERYWGATPCGGQVAVLAGQPLAAGADSTTDGWVTFESTLGANDLRAPASTYTECTISLARWQWPTRARQAGDWNMLCLTVVHELGHLLGHPHSLAPHSVMAAVFTDEEDVPAICRENRLLVETSAGLISGH